MLRNLASATSSPSTPLSPKFNVPIADIVAVHGLTADYRATWTDPATGTLWLRDLFPHETYNVRILSFAYELRSSNPDATDRLLALATSLVGELCAERLLTCATQRPIIFICHGFGGLIVKRAMAYSGSKRTSKLQHLRDVFVSTYGIIFFGTPHRGIEKTALLLHCERSGRSRHGPTQLELSLMKSSELLQDIEDQFAPMTNRLAILNLWEGEPTSFGKQRKYVVEKSSAAPPWPDADCNEIPADHEGMTKFASKRSPGFILVLSALSRYIVSAGTEIPERWKEDIELLRNERCHEAEELLGTRLPMVKTTNPNLVNEWYCVPRGSSKYFVGRSQYSEILRDALGLPSSGERLSPHRIFVIWGLGGSGKTQFCLRYAEENRSRYWGVFWIDASSHETAEAGYAWLGQLAERGTSCGAGMVWLSQIRRPWLLILDNADDPDMDLSSYLPGGGGYGHIVLTTRNPRAIEHNTAGCLRFSGMDPEEGLHLFLKTAFADAELKRMDDKDHKAAQGIASELGYLALALANAGTAIRLKIFTLERYLHYYIGYRRRTIASPSIQSIADADIVTTWEIPFQRIVKHEGKAYKDAVDLLHVFAFMHFESIPENIFRSQQTIRDKTVLDDFVQQWTFDNYWDGDLQTRLRACLSVLYSHSLIDHDVEKRVISLHPVVQRWAQSRLSTHDQRRWLNAAISILGHGISPFLEASGRNFRRSMIPHIEACIRNLALLYGSMQVDSQKRAIEVEKFAQVFAENGLWEKARVLQKAVVDFRTQSLGRRHPHTIRAQRSFADSNWNLFDLKEVLNVQATLRWTLFFSRPKLSDWIIWPPWRPDHVSYCLNLSDLTQSLWLAGNRDIAKWTGQRAVNGLNKHLGPDDPLTLNAKFNLARTMMHLGDHQNSHQLLLEVLRKRRILVGPEHPETLMVRNEIGINMYFSKRNLAASQRILENTLAARKRVLGAEHAYTLWSMNDLAKVHSTRGNHKQAIELLEDTLPVARRTLGELHVGVFMTQSNLARVYALAERWPEAEFLIADLRQKTAKDHPDYLLLVLGLVYVLISRGRLVEAERECIRVLENVEKFDGRARDDAQLMSIVEHLALIHQRQGRDGEINALRTRFPSLGYTYTLRFSI